jgi:hypothetical protein
MDPGAAVLRPEGDRPVTVMDAIRFRLVKAGAPEAPVRVFAVTQDDGPPVFHEASSPKPCAAESRWTT